MDTVNANPKTYRFGVFELDGASLELRRKGLPVALAPQPAAVLAMLLEGRGRVVTREAIRERVWGGEEPTHVDFDQGINTCVRQIRAALLDRADSPRFVETLPRRGYRLLVEVQESSADGPLPPARDPGPGTVEGSWRRWAVAAAVAVGIVAAALAVRSPRPDASVTPATPHPGRAMLAVLPFANLSSDPEQEYFSDGLTEELIAQLGRIEPSRLGVIARTSIARYKGSDTSAAEIGAELDVEYILEGSVRRTAEEVRITAQLIRVDDETHLWAESFERPLADTFAVQREVASRVTAALLSRLLPALPTARDPAELTAYDHYLRGRYHFTRYDAVGYAAAIESYRRALAVDAESAAAWAGLGEAQAFLSWAGSEPEVVFPEAEAAALRAIELDPSLAAAHNVLGIVRLYYDWDWSAAEGAFARALELDAGFAEAYHWSAGLYSALGRHDEAIEQDLLAQRLDPVSLTVRSDLCWYYNFARRWDDAVEACRFSLELEPHHRWSLAGLVLAHRRSGDLEAAWAANTRLLETTRPESLTQLEREGALTDPKRAFARSDELELERALEEEAAGTTDALDLAFLLGRAGRLDDALDHLMDAVDQRIAWVVFLDADPRFDPLRGEARFEELRRRVGLTAPTP